MRFNSGLKGLKFFFYHPDIKIVSRVTTWIMQNVIKIGALS
jgi:hypothetical protein